MKRLLFGLAATTLLAMPVDAQRRMDNLDRGLVAQKTSDGVFCTWRINADEWDNNTLYNIYRGDTKLNDTPLKASNFTDPAGTLDASYTVRPVINGVEAEACAPIKPWEKNYTIITPQHAPEITAALTPNDATAADVDGDGQLEIIMKYDNGSPDFHNGDNGIFTVVECLKMDGTVLWWINFGPNMGDFQNNEINIAAYDWDGDGKAEVVFRAADGTTIHQADGTTYTVGDPSINYRGNDWPSGQWFMHWGKEYLIYADGLTGEPYDELEFPLKRVEDADNPNGILSGGAYDNLVNNEWGDGYGHRSSKYFFAAPYLDGKHPSIFLARGIYTKHKMITYDVDAATHKLVERWRWNDLGGEWHGQGYHNMGIADVDWDGRDEIVYGSMVIDDNGFGLSTTGLGHGDSQHCGDFDPYTHGQEIFCCNEDRPNNNFRDATTSKIYYRTTGGNDDGRANCANFIDEYPGSEGISSRDPNIVGGASHKAITGDYKSTVSITQNFRVFWDGDLCDESFDYSSGKNTQGAIFKAKQGKIAILEGSKTNNDTKGTPCFQGDILGDWREEYIMRDGDNNIRIYTTDYPTEHRIYSLWYDHQYRNAMVWQMCGYNQTPHVSFALSEFEDITVPPSPVTLTGRIEIANNGIIDASHNDKNILLSDNGDMTVSAGENVAPTILTVNAPTWVQGHNDNNNITTQTFTHTISSGTFGGDMKLIKQGYGKLILPGATHTYAGNTEVWGGTLAVDGELTNSSVWLNRFGMLETNSLNIPKGIDMNYASELHLGNDSHAGSITTGNMTLGFGAIIELDVFADLTIDKINASKLTIEKKDWDNGPKYLQPIFKIIPHAATDADALPEGKYLIGEIAAIDGNITDIIMLGLDEMKKELIYEDGKLYLNLTAYVPGNKTWTGGDNAIWDIDNSTGFLNAETSENDIFVPGDNVTFDDSAVNTNVVIEGRLKPGSVTFNNETKDYILSGDGQIVGETKLTKTGAGTLTVNNINSYTGGTYINGGKLVAGVFSNEIGTDLGALSDVNSRIYMNNDAILAVNATATLGQRISLNGKAKIEVPDGVTLTLGRGISTGALAQVFTKIGKGTLTLGINNNGISRLVIAEGHINGSEADNTHSYPSNIEFVNGTLYDPADMYSYSSNRANLIVEEGNTGNWYLDPRCDYYGKLSGAGKLTVYAAGPRNYLNGDWSGFEGELVASQSKRGSYDPDFSWNNSFGMPNATLNISSGTTFNAQDKKMTLANLKGSGVYHGSNTLTIGNNNSNISYNGSFTGNPTIVKTGQCDMSLNKLIKEIKQLTANAGTVSLTASKAPYNTTFLNAPLYIEGDAKLRGRGTVADITVSGNGILEPGSYSKEQHYGPIFSTGNVTINPGATLSLYLRAAGKGNACSYLDVKGTLRIDGNVIFEMNPDYEPKIDDEFQVWIAKNFSGDPTIDLPELPEGLDWDATGLTDGTGILKVVQGNGVAAIESDLMADCKIYTLSGTLVKSMICRLGEALETIRTLDRGVYVLRYTCGNISRSVKIRN